MGRLRPGKRQLFVVNGIGVAVVTAIGLVVLATNGLPGRFPADALQAASYLGYTMKEPFREGLCFIGSDNTFADFNQSTCLAETANKPTVLLLDDSQAAQLWPGMHEVLPQVQTLQATAAFCAIFVDEPANVRPACKDLADFVFRDFLLHHHVDTVFYGGRWGESDLPCIAQSILWMKQHGIEVYLFGPMIEYDEPFPRVLATSLRDHRPDLVATHLTSSLRELDVRLKAMARDQWHVPYISYYDNLCTPGCVSYGAPGVPLLFDEHHLTAAGSILFVQTVHDRNQLLLTLSNSGRQ